MDRQTPGAHGSRVTQSSKSRAVLLAAALLLISLFRYLAGPLRRPELENLKVMLRCCWAGFLLS